MASRSLPFSLISIFFFFFCFSCSCLYNTIACVYKNNNINVPPHDDVKFEINLMVEQEEEEQDPRRHLSCPN